jgi:ferredoxin-type protein NapH
VTHRTLKTNRLLRLGGFLAGVLSFYAPFQLVLRGLTAVLPGATVPTSAAGMPLPTSPLGAPLLWFAQPWQWPAAGEIAAWWLPIVVLPVVAIVAGPVFCGWLCPAGALPEMLGRLVPDRFKIDVRDRVDVLPVRLGFLVGYLVAPWASALALSHFTGMSDLVGGLFANSIGFAYFTWTGLLFIALWIVPLGPVPRRHRDGTRFRDHGALAAHVEDPREPRGV